MEKFKLLFKSKKIFDNIHQQKKLYKVFDSIWLEILQNQKGIYVCCTTKELFGALNDVWSRTLRMCGNCMPKDCFVYKWFSYVFEDFGKNDIEKQLPNSLWKVYLNVDKYKFKLERVLDN